MFHTRTIPLFARLPVLASLLVCCALCACNKAPPKQPAQQQPGAHTPRIVSLSPALSITLQDLGLGHLIVGRHAWDHAVDQSIPICGDQTGIDYETLLRTKPTHMLTQWGSRELPSRLGALAAEHGWDVEDFRLLELSEIGQCADSLFTRFGSFSDPAASRFDMSSSARAVRDQIESHFVPIQRDGESTKHPKSSAISETPKRTLLLASIEPIAAFGPGSWHVQLLESLGGQSAVAVGDAYITLDLEDVIRLAPERIVLFAPRPSATENATEPSKTNSTPNSLGSLASHDSIPAIAQNHIAIIDHPHALIPSTAMTHIADELRGLLMRWDGARE